MLHSMVNKYWGGQEMNRILTREQEAKVTRMVGNVKEKIDNYLPLPVGADTLKIACEVCNYMFLEMARGSKFLEVELRREREINMADPGALDSAADMREL